jgi:Asp-tRNA(Asn)/Glu-tRNA(Gln) amidotransferase A subunit family amidase
MARQPARWPSIALPCPEELDGLPFSLMVTGRPGSDHALLKQMQALWD